jgi:type IV pilus assembly protein PilX
MFFVSRSKTLKGPVDCLNNQQGAALIIVLIVMAVLTLVGLSAINTATVENKIVGNERIYQENFYLAESSVNEAAQKIENETDREKLMPSSSDWDWLHDDGTSVDFTVSDNWEINSSDDNAEKAAVSDDALYSTVNKGVRKGSSLDIGATRLYEYAVFGQGKSNNGSVIIEIGYLKRF